MPYGSVSPFKKFILNLLRPFLWIFGFVFFGLYKTFWGWWADERRSRILRRDFAKEIRENLGFLFDQFGGQIVPNLRKYPPVADYAVVTVAVQTVLLRFMRGRGSSVSILHRLTARTHGRKSAKCLRTPTDTQERAKCLNIFVSLILAGSYIQISSC